MLFGVVFLSHQLGSFTGLWLAGYLYDRPSPMMRCGGSRSRSVCSPPPIHWPIKERPVARLAAQPA